MKKTGAEIVMECLLEQKVSVVFGYPGGTILNVYDALYKYSEGKKRLHRQGVEHGSAKWAEKKEIRSLADKTHHKEFLPLRSADGRHVFDARGNRVQ